MTTSLAPIKDAPSPRAETFLLLLTLSLLVVSLGALGLIAVGDALESVHRDRYGMFPASRATILAAMGAQRDRLTLAPSPSTDCLTLTSPSTPVQDPVLCNAFALRGTPVVGDLTTLDDRPWQQGLDARLRWWVPHPLPIAALWVTVRLPADQWALAHRLALAGLQQHPDRFTMDLATQQANTARSAQHALGGPVDATVESLRVINASTDGLSATALFRDGLTLPMQRLRVNAPWTILSEGPFDQLPALLAAVHPTA